MSEILAAIATLISLLMGLADSEPTPAPEPAPVQCYEDEVIVWTGDTHGACVPLDNMWQDPETGTIHWNVEDERKS